MDDVSVMPREYAPHSTPGAIRVYSKETSLFKVMAVFALLFWLGVTVISVGTIWLILPFVYVLGLAAHSYFISHLQGNAVKVGAAQFPELHARFNACCQAVGLERRPDFYLMSGNGVLNAFATRFLRQYYVVLLSDIVDALDDDEDALNFYIGHELGHIAQKHLVHHWWIQVAMMTPLLGAAYSRAREYTCDQYGLACCGNTRSAMHALGVLAVGGKRWKSMNFDSYIGQGELSGGFWMSLNELTGDYPWLCKRIARVQRGDQAAFPTRHWLAWILSALVPRTGFGIIGGIIFYTYLLGVGAAVGIPAYKQYTARAHMAATRSALQSAYTLGLAATDSVSKFTLKQGHAPASLREAGFKGDPTGSAVLGETGILTVKLAPPQQGSELYFVAIGEGADASWSCSANQDTDLELLPEGCQSHDDPANAP